MYIELVSKIVYYFETETKKRTILGRCARAGRHGTAFSLVSTDDEAHLLDLYLFLNRTFDINKSTEIGTIPPDVLEDEHEAVLKWLANQHIVSGLNIKMQYRVHFERFIFVSVGYIEHRQKCIQKVFEHTASSIG